MPVPGSRRLGSSGIDMYRPDNLHGHPERHASVIIRAEIQLARSTAPKRDRLPGSPWQAALPPRPTGRRPRARARGEASPRPGKDRKTGDCLEFHFKGLCASVVLSAVYRHNYLLIITGIAIFSKFNAPGEARHPDSSSTWHQARPATRARTRSPSRQAGPPPTGLPRRGGRAHVRETARARSRDQNAIKDRYLSFISCRISLTLAFKIGISSSAVSQTCLRSIPKY